MVEQAVTACVNDNMDLACAFVQKTTVDKAVVEIDRHLFSVNWRLEYFNPRELDQKMSFILPKLCINMYFSQKKKNITDAPR